MKKEVIKTTFKEKGVLLMNRLIRKIPIIRFIDTSSLTDFYSKFFVVISTILVLASFAFAAIHVVMAIANFGYAIYITCILIIAVIALVIMIEEGSPDQSMITEQEKKEE